MLAEVIYVTWLVIEICNEYNSRDIGSLAVVSNIRNVSSQCIHPQYIKKTVSWKKKLPFNKLKNCCHWYDITPWTSYLYNNDLCIWTDFILIELDTRLLIRYFNYGEKAVKNGFRPCSN